MSQHQLRRDQHINAAPATVGDAIASPHGLSTWLCDDARSEKRTGGRLVFQWLDGRQALGRWTEFDPSRQLAWTWRAESDEHESSVRFTLAAAGDGTEVTVTHDGVPDDDVERLDRMWSDGLADLRVFVETGENGRMLRRPMMGIMFDVVSPDMAATKNLGVDRGILVSGTTPEHGAAKAGILVEDVLVAIGGHELSDWASISDALDQRRAGESVDVTLWRAGEQMTVPVELTARERLDTPTTIEGVVELAKQSTTQMVDTLNEVLEGMTDEAASFRPSDDEWSVKQVLAHLCVVERYSQDGFSRAAADDQPSGWAMEAFELRQALMANASIDALRDWTIADFRSTEDLAQYILAQNPPAHVVRELADNFHWGPEHVAEHVQQIRNIREAFAP